MRILITTQVYPPELHPTAVMVRELARYLVSCGWQVTVAAGLPHHPYGKVYAGHRVLPFERRLVEGIEVLRLWHPVNPSRSVAVRASLFVTQAMSTAVEATLARRADVVLVYGPPLIGPGLAWIVALRHRARLVTVVYDIYPDVAVEAGKVKNRALIGLARIAERFQYWSADKIIVLSEGFKKTLAKKGVPENKIVVLPVWLDADEIQPMARDNAWRRENGIPLESFVVLYAGTIGVVSGAEIVPDAAAVLRDRCDVLFLFVGDGEARPRVEARARELGLNNLRFLPFQDRERLAEVQATADVGLVTLAPGRGRTSVPSKVIGYMAAGRPVIASVDVDSDTARELVEAKAGLVTPPSDAGALADAVLTLANDPERRAAMGTSAREAMLALHSKCALLERYRDELERVVGST